MNSSSRASTRRKSGELATYRAPVRMALVMCSVPSGRWSDGRFQRASTISTPRNETVLNANVASDPASAISRPPSAGPMARPTFMLTPLSSAACGISSRDTSSGWIAWNDGMVRACPIAISASSPSRLVGVALSVPASSISPAAPASISAWPEISTLRRSRMSPSAPDGTTSRNTGSVVAVWTSAIWSAEPPRSPMSHWAPTVCAHVPMLEANWASHSARNALRRRGAHAETVTP